MPCKLYMYIYTRFQKCCNIENIHLPANMYIIIFCFLVKKSLFLMRKDGDNYSVMKIV